MQIKNMNPQSALRMLATRWFGIRIGSKSQLDDLSPLVGMPLISLHCISMPLANLSPLRELPLIELNIRSTKVTPASVAALQKALPTARSTGTIRRRTRNSPTLRVRNSPSYFTSSAHFCRSTHRDSISSSSSTISRPLRSEGYAGRTTRVMSWRLTSSNSRTVVRIYCLCDTVESDEMSQRGIEAATV